MQLHTFKLLRLRLTPQPSLSLEQSLLPVIIHSWGDVPKPARWAIPNSKSRPFLRRAFFSEQVSGGAVFCLPAANSPSAPVATVAAAAPDSGPVGAPTPGLWGSSESNDIFLTLERTAKRLVGKPIGSWSLGLSWRAPFTRPGSRLLGHIQAG
jgi:hypothetical protein